MLALSGLVLALRVERVPAADPQKKFRADFFGDFFARMKLIRADRVLFLGALLQPTILFYGKEIFHFNDAQSGWLQISLSIGIGLGSFVAGFLSGGKIEYGLIPLGMIGLTAFAVVLSRAGLGITSFALNLGLLGFFGGFYNVPVNAIMQYRPDAGNKGKVIAAGAWLSWGGVLLASGF